MILKEKKGIFFIIIITLALYWDLYRYHFLYSWDDNNYVVFRSPLLQLAKGNWSALWDLLTPMSALEGKFIEYFPIRDLTYAIDTLLGGIHPTSFHITNLLFHLGITILVWSLSQKLGLTKKGAFFATLLFAIHPLAVEPVVWISSRKDLTYTLFILLAINAFWPIVQGDKNISMRRQWLLVYLFSFFASLSKGAGSLTPFLLLWIFLLEVKPQYWKSFALKLLPLFLFVIVWLIFIIKIGQSNHVIISRAVHIAGFPLYQRLFIAIGEPIWAILLYFLPVHLLPDATSDFHFHFWLTNSYTWIMLLSLSFVLIKFIQKKISSRFLLLSGLATLAVMPYSGIIPVYQFRASRFYYLFLIFFSIFLIYLYEKYLHHWKLIPLFLLLIFFFTQSYRYKRAWKEDKTLWLYTIQVDPANMMGNKILANYAMRARKYRQAKKLFIRALKRQPSSFIMHLKIAFLNYYIAIQTPNIEQERRERLLQEAKKIFFQYLHHHSEIAQRKSRQGLGYIALFYKKYSLAENLLKASLKYDLKEIGSVLALGNLYWKTGRYNKAYQIIKKYYPYFHKKKKYQQWLKKHLIMTH